MQARRLLVGDFVGVFGVQGELKLRSHTDPVAAIGKYLPWYVKRRGEEHVIDKAQCRVHGKGLVVRLPGVEDRDAADSWVGAEVWVDRDRLPALPEGQYYWVDLEGLQVFNEQGVDFGKVSHLFSNGANDVIVAVGDRERLIPYVTPDFVKSVDLAAGRIVVDWDPDF